MAKTAVRFKESVAEYERLRKEIAARRFAPIYLLMGEEGYFIDSLCDALASTILTPAEQSFNQITVYGKDTDAAQVVNLCRQMPMMDSHEVIIVREAQQLRNIEKLSLYTSKPQPSTILVVCHKDRSVDRRSAFYKQCAAAGVVFESVRPRDYEIGPWLTSFIASRGLKIDAKAVQMLTDQLGCDISKISNEVDKLLLALPEGTRSVNDAIIEQYVGISKDYNNFELRSALIAKDVLKANQIIKYFGENPKNNPLQMTLAVLFNFFSNLMLAYYAPQRNEQGIAAFLGLRSPWQAKDYMAAMQKFSGNKVLQIISAIRNCDAKSKGVGNPSISDEDLLRDLVFFILH